MKNSFGLTEEATDSGLKPLRNIQNTGKKKSSTRTQVRMLMIGVLEGGAHRLPPAMKTLKVVLSAIVATMIVRMTVTTPYAAASPTLRPMNARS